MSTCTVLIGTRGAYKPCGLSSWGDTCSTHRAFVWELPRTREQLASNAGIRGARDVQMRPRPARPTVPVRGQSLGTSRASIDDGDYGGAPV